jgi:hypothetical protein
VSEKAQEANMIGLHEGLELGVALFPIALIVTALLLMERRGRIRLAECARQIAVTDAIHGELGAIVAPVVRRRLWGRWRLVIPVPFDDLDSVSRVVRAAYRGFDAPERAIPGRFEIVLSPQEKFVPRRERAAVVAARRSRGESVSWT